MTVPMMPVRPAVTFRAGPGVHDHDLRILVLDIDMDHGFGDVPRCMVGGVVRHPGRVTGYVVRDAVRTMGAAKAQGQQGRRRQDQDGSAHG
jgi:hypothetical protein